MTEHGREDESRDDGEGELNDEALDDEELDDEEVEWREWVERERIQDQVDDWLDLDGSQVDEAPRWALVAALALVVLQAALLASYSWNVLGEAIVSGRAPPLNHRLLLGFLACLVLVWARQLIIALPGWGRRRSVTGTAELQRRVGRRDDELELLIGGETLVVPAKGHSALDTNWSYRATFVDKSRRIVALKPWQRIVSLSRVRRAADEEPDERAELRAFVSDDWLELDESLDWLSKEPVKGCNWPRRLRTLVLPGLAVLALVAVIGVGGTLYMPRIMGELPPMPGALAVVFACALRGSLMGLVEGLLPVGQAEGPAELWRAKGGKLELVIRGESFRVPVEGSEDFDTSWIRRVTWLRATRRIIELEPLRRR